VRVWSQAFRCRCRPSSLGSFLSSPPLDFCEVCELKKAERRPRRIGRKALIFSFSAAFRCFANGRLFFRFLKFRSIKKIGCNVRRHPTGTFAGLVSNDDPPSHHHHHRRCGPIIYPSSCTVHVNHMNNAPPDTHKNYTSPPFL
jgi:hypothetical protein